MKPVKNFIDKIIACDSDKTVTVSVGGNDYRFHLVWNNADATDKIASVWVTNDRGFNHQSEFPYVVNLIINWEKQTMRPRLCRKGAGSNGKDFPTVTFRKENFATHKEFCNWVGHEMTKLRNQTQWFTI